MLLTAVRSGKLQPSKLVTHRFAMNDIMKAYDTFGDAAKEGALKVFIPTNCKCPMTLSPPELGDHRIVTTLCPRGKERMRRLLSLVQSGRSDPSPLITHRFSLHEIPQAYQIFGARSEGVLKVAIKTLANGTISTARRRKTVT